MRIGSKEDRIQVLPVHISIGAGGGRDVSGIVGGRMLGLDIDHDADLILPLGTIGLHRGAVGSQQMMRGDRRLEEVAVSRRQRAMEIAAVGDDPRFVERRPPLYAAVELTKQDGRVIGEPIGDIGIEPAAAVVEGGGKVPMIEGEEGLNPVFQERIDQLVVEVEARRIHCASAGRQDSAPGDAEAVGFEPQAPHQSNILGRAAIMIASDVAGVPVVHQTGRVGKAVPDAGAGSIGEWRALDLVGCRGTAPKKSAGKLRVAHGLVAASQKRGSAVPEGLMSIDQSIERRPIQHSESPALALRDQAQMLQFAE